MSLLRFMLVYTLPPLGQEKVITFRQNSRTLAGLAAVAHVKKQRAEWRSLHPGYPCRRDWFSIVRLVDLQNSEDITRFTR